MKLAIASDLHLEFSDITLTNDQNADVLILAGDILVANDLYDHAEPEVPYTDKQVSKLGKRQRFAHNFRQFLKRVSREFPHVIYVAGNHEFYHGKWVGSLLHLKFECDKFDNVYFLENNVVALHDVLFVGATIWTDCHKNDPITLRVIDGCMSDYRLIRNDELNYSRLRPQNTIVRHTQTIKNFKQIFVENKDSTTVVVGHHAPSSMSIDQKYRNDHHMNGAYYSDLSDMILDNTQIKLWVHGHTHTPFDYQIGDTRVVCNPRGYHGYEKSADNFQLKYLDI